MLQAARSRRIGQWLGFVAAMPGLALIQPNALVALVLFALVWFVTARVRAGLLHHVSWWVVARDLAIVAVVGVVGLVAAPIVSAQLASTQSYEWKDRVSVWTALVEVVGGRLQIPDVLWGLVLLIALGIGWIALRARAALPVVAMWGAASCSTSWRRRRRCRGPRSSPATGTTTRSGWRRSRPSPASCSSPRPPRPLRELLRKVPGARVAARRGRASSRCSSSRYSRSGSTARPATGCSPASSGRTTRRRSSSRSRRRTRCAASHALIPAGQGVVGRPENGSPLMWPLFGTNTLYRSIPIPTTGDEIVIGTGFDDMANRPDVCAAMARHDIRWAIDSTHVYWLDRPERSSGPHGPGARRRRRARRGPTATTRSTASPAAGSACGHPAATPRPPPRRPPEPAGRHTPRVLPCISSWTARNALGPTRDGGGGDPTQTP